MSFGGALNRILQNFLTPDPLLGISYISKVDLADLYMRVWVRMENALSVAFLIFKRTPSEPELVGFHLFLTMVYVNSAPYICMATGKVANLYNMAMAQRDESVRFPQ